MAKNCIIHFSFLFLSGFYALPASACNLCTMSFFDYILPPVFIWQFFSVGWFIAASFAAKNIEYKTWGLPNIWLAFIIGFGSVFVGWIFSFGPLLSMPLLIPPAVFAINSARKKVRGKWDKKQRGISISVSIAGVIFLLGISIFSLWTHLSRTPGKFIVIWGVNGPGLSLINKIKDSPRANIDEIRLVVSKAELLPASRLAGELAENGDPITDFPILLKALERSRKSFNYHEEDFEAAIGELTGLNLKPKTSIEDWQKAFNKSLSPALNKKESND